MYSLGGHGQSAEVITKCLRMCYFGASWRLQIFTAKDTMGQHHVWCNIWCCSANERILSKCTFHSLSELQRLFHWWQTVLDVVHQLVPFIRNSCKLTDLFRDVQQESSEQFSATMDTCSSTRSPSISLRPLCPTRWTVKASAINSVVCN